VLGIASKIHAKIEGARIKHTQSAAKYHPCTDDFQSAKNRNAWPRCDFEIQL
jgi:hypothetical protein